MESESGSTGNDGDIGVSRTVYIFWVRFTRFFKLLCDGGTFQLFGGSLGLACLLLDYGWAQPAIANKWDPRIQGSGTRIVVTAFAVMYVFSCVPATIVYWRFVKAGTMCRAIQLALGCCLFLCVSYSNAYSNDYYNDAHWHGAFWSKSYYLLCVSVLCCVIGYMFSFSYEEANLFDYIYDALNSIYSFIVKKFKRGEATVNSNREPLLSLPVDEDTEQQEPLRFEEQDETEEELIEQQNQEEEEEREIRRRTRSESTTLNLGADESPFLIVGGFCQASHAPFVFGCSAYILALSVCAFSLILSFYSFEPNTQCFASLDKQAYAPLVVSNTCIGSWKLGDDRNNNNNNNSLTMYITDSGVQVVSYQKQTVIWQNVPNEAFVRMSMGLFHTWSSSSVMYFQDTVAWTSTTQTITRVQKLNESNIIEISGALESNVEGKILDYTIEIDTLDHGGSRDASEISMSIRTVIPKRDLSFWDIARIYVISSKQKRDRFYGFGSQLSYESYKASCIPIISREKGFGRGLQPFTFLMNRFNEETGGSWQHAYTSVPFYMNSNGQSSFVHSQGAVIFDLMNDDRVNIEIAQSAFPPSTKRVGQGTIEVNTRIDFGKSTDVHFPKKLLTKHTHQAGRMKELPHWVGNGLLLNVQGGTQQVLQKLKVFKGKNIPLSGIVIRDWAGMFKTLYGTIPFLNWQPNTNLYPEFKTKTLVETFKSIFPNIKVMLYFSPRVTTAKTKLYNKTAFDIAKEKHCLVRSTSDGEGILISGFKENNDMQYGMIELGKPECREWFAKEIIQPYILDHEISGWIADHGEGLKLCALNKDGSPVGPNGHNEYVSHWLETNQLSIPSHLRGEILYISRTASMNSINNTMLHNVGLQLSSWDSHDGLSSALKGHLSSGLSGLTITNSYLGGVYTACDAFGLIRFLRTKQLVMRWVEMSTFSDAVMLTHDGISLTQNDCEMKDLLLDDEVLSHLSKFLTLSKSLWPYKQELMREANMLGYPLVRHMWFEFPEDSNTMMLNRQFMLGSKIVVCPVLEADTTSVSCYLPKQTTWVRLFENDVYIGKGETFTCTATIGNPCVFISPDLHSKIFL